MKANQQILVIMVLVYAAAMSSAGALENLGNVNTAHSGGTDKCGCHTNRKTDEYHCHTRKQRGGDCPPQESNAVSPSSVTISAAREVS